MSHGHPGGQQHTDRITIGDEGAQKCLEAMIQAPLAAAAIPTDLATESVPATGFSDDEESTHTAQRTSLDQILVFPPHTAHMDSKARLASQMVAITPIDRVRRTWEDAALEENKGLFKKLKTKDTRLE